MTTFKELHQQAKALSIKGYSRMTKAELGRAINEHEQAEKEAQLTSQLKTDHISYFITGKTYTMKSIDGNFSFPFEIRQRDALNEITIAFDCHRIDKNNSLVKTGGYSIEGVKVNIIDGIECISYPHVYNRKTNKCMTFTAQAAENSTPAITDQLTHFDECAYSPDYQENLAVLDDVPEDRIAESPSAPVKANIKRKPAKRKDSRAYYDFSYCPTAYHIREIFKRADIKDVEYIARTFRDIQLRTDGKRMTKQDYVEAIVKLYFPNEQPVSRPVKKTPQVNKPFIPGHIYFKTGRGEKSLPKIELVKIIKRNGEYLTVQEVSYPDLVPMFKPERVRVYANRFLTQEGFELDKRDDFNGEEKDCVYSTIEYTAECFACQDAGRQDNNFLAITTYAGKWSDITITENGVIKPDMSTDEDSIQAYIEAHKKPEYTPSYDIDFDETAYSPDYQANSAVLDDVPAEREQDIQAASANVEQQNKIICFDYDDMSTRKIKSKQLDEICNHNAALLESCLTPEEMRSLLDGVNECTMNFTMTHIKDYRGITGEYCWQTLSGAPVHYTHEEMIQELINRVMYCREDKRKHEAKTETHMPASDLETDCELWQKHTCQYCEGKINIHSWTHEQFVKGMLLCFESEDADSKNRDNAGLGLYLYRNYSLVQLWKLARFFGLDVPKIELKSESKTEAKKYQIAQILANEIECMDHVHLCTYEDPDFPALLPELEQHMPRLRKLMLADKKSGFERRRKQEALDAERKRKGVHVLSSLWDISRYDSYGRKRYSETRKQNVSLIEQCKSHEQIKDAFLTLSNNDMLNQAEYMRIHVQFTGLHGRIKSSEEVAEEIADIIIARRQRKAKAEARKNSPEPVKKSAVKSSIRMCKPKKLDESRQLMITFDEDNAPHEAERQPDIKPQAPAPIKLWTRRRAVPRNRIDESNQLTFSFDEIADSNTDKRIAA